MTGNNNQRLEIWAGLTNRFSYAEFSRACERMSVEPLPAMEFAQKAGIAQCAVSAYPDVPVAEAYLRFINDNRPVLPPLSQTSPVSQPVISESVVVSGCGSCGGGRVR